MFHPIRDIKRVIDAEVQKARLASRRATAQAVGWFVVAGLGLMGVAMLFLAAFLGLSQVYDHIIAALICGGTILVIAVLVALLLGPWRSRRAEKDAQAEATQARADVSSDFSQIMALVEGFTAGARGTKGLNKLLLIGAMGLGLGLLSRKRDKKPKPE